MLYIIIYIYINIHAYTHIHICITLYLHHMRGIYIIAHFCPISWWCRKLNSRSMQIAPQFFFLNMAITGWPWPRGFPTYSYRFMVRKMLYCNLWGFFDVVRILAESFDDSRKPSKTAAAWSFRRAFHSAPKSFLTFWIVVPLCFFHICARRHTCDSH